MTKRGQWRYTDNANVRAICNDSADRVSLDKGDRPENDCPRKLCRLGNSYGCWYTRHVHCDDRSRLTDESVILVLAALDNEHIEQLAVLPAGGRNASGRDVWFSGRQRDQRESRHAPPHDIERRHFAAGARQIVSDRRRPDAVRRAHD